MVLWGFPVPVDVLAVDVGLELVELLADIVANVLVRLLRDLVELSSSVWQQGTTSQYIVCSGARDDPD
jgi:hypothetical protein